MVVLAGFLRPTAAVTIESHPGDVLKPGIRVAGSRDFLYYQAANQSGVHPDAHHTS